MFTANLKLPKLRALALACITLSEVHFTVLSHMSSNIVSLDLSSSLVSFHALQLVPHMCSQLRAFGLSDTQLNNESLSFIVAACPSIVHLDLSNNSNLTDAGIAAVAQNLKNLQSLNLWSLKLLTDASLVHLYTHCANTLHTLHLYSVEGFGEAFDTLLVKCTKLRTLFYMDEHFDPFNPIGTLPNSLQNLTTLVLFKGAITESNLAQVGRYAVNLEVLSIYEKGRYSSDSLFDIFTNCTKLKELYVAFESMNNVEIMNTDAFAVLALKMWSKMSPI